MFDDLPISWAEFRRRSGRAPNGHVGVMGELGAMIESLDPNGLRVRIPFQPVMVGDTRWNVVHSGLLMILLDSLCGISIIQKMTVPTPIATLDLRVDYLRAVPAGEDLFVTANCYKIGHNVAFTRAAIYTDDPEDPAAIANGSFMLGTAGDPPPMATMLKGQNA
ncbi:MAG TPA: PaaI family thioesterase [Alphaproteobacteria bacterium]|nr:PaaI family thioesterase [Alphaproteobacteria bacterium]